MAFVVTTYPSEKPLQDAIGGTVITYASEAELEVAVNAATDAKFVVAKGGKFTVCDDPTLLNLVSVVAKEGKFTTVVGTP